MCGCGCGMSYPIVVYRGGSSEKGGLLLGVCTFGKWPELLSNLLLTAHAPTAKRKSGGGSMENVGS